MVKSALEPVTLIAIFGISLCLGLLINYISCRNEYHKVQTGDNRQYRPPQYPTLVPYLGVIVPFLWNTPGFLQRATSYAGRLTSTRITVAPGWDVYLFQDHETIKQIWKKSANLSAVRVHVWACKYLFGMPEEWLARYAADDSGPLPKPYPGSNVPPHLRIQRILNGKTEKALNGSGFEPMLRRFRNALLAQIEQLDSINEDWTEIEDFHRFIHNTVGTSLILAIFGPSILQLNPGFMSDLYEFEHALPWLARGIPSWIMPSIYAVRRRLQQNIKKWYVYARAHFDESCVDDDCDGDIYWGSKWMRERQKILDIIQDDDTLASTDMGLAWASVGNVVAAATMAVIHVVSTPGLSSHVQDQVDAVFGDQSLAAVDLKTLSSIPLLASIYAETLRLHAKSFTVVHSPVKETYLGKYRLPKDSIGLINSHVSHLDESFWNTKDGMHPVGSFWPQRFLVDLNDFSSGPSKFTHQSIKHDSTEAGKPFFSLKGLEGSWIPYGGGHLVCPGRFLAKNVMMLTFVLLTQEFEIEVLTKKIKFDTTWFGFGTEIPKHAISIRMKRRINHRNQRR